MTRTLQALLPGLLPVLLLVLLLPRAALARGAVLTGRVTNAETGAALADVVVTAQSPALPSEHIVVTDAQGVYLVEDLPAGAYTLHFEGPQLAPFRRAGVGLTAGTQTLFDVQLAPSDEEEPVYGCGPPPSPEQVLSGDSLEGYSSPMVTSALLAHGVLPDGREVRVEDFASQYMPWEGDAPPIGHARFAVHLDGFPSPATPGDHVLRLGLRARELLDEPWLVARDVTMEVAFDPAVVSHVRRPSGEARPLADGGTADAPLVLGEAHSGEAHSELYEVRLRPGARAFSLGTVRLRFTDAGTGLEGVEAFPLPRRNVRPSFLEAAPATRLLYVAVAFAEKLAGAPGVPAPSWPRLRALWGDVGGLLHRGQRVQELGEDLARAEALAEGPQGRPGSAAFDPRPPVR
jgi:hypothetical protein